MGIQYLVGMVIYFCTAGLFAMAIRTELLSPVHHVFTSQVYVEIVGEHGTMMMMLMTSVIVGPFGNYLVPLMIGSKRVAFPRVEALSFWLTPCAFIILLSGLLLGGFPFGWTGYAPLSIQSTVGADSYAVAFGLMGVSMILAGFNIIVTVICYRAPGMRWSRLPIFVWSMVATSFLFVLAAPVLVGGMYMLLTDRTAQTAFFEDSLGGSSYLYQNLFWFFGHPEVYILALPGFGIVMEILPVFTRKPLFAYKVACAGMIGVTLLSFFVWQHHLFDSGINPDMRPLFMLTTELISIPTGFIYLVALGTLWRAKIRLTVPMLFAPRHAVQLPDRRHLRRVPVGRARRHHRARQLLRDGALPLHDHGRADLRVHGRPVLLAAEDDGDQAQQAARPVAVLAHVHRVQLDVPAAVRGRHGGSAPPGVRVRAEPDQPLNDWVSISSFVLGGSILLFVINFVWSTVIVREREEGNPWQSRGLEWQIASPPPPQNFEHIPVVLSAPYDYGVKDAQPVADLNPPVGVISAAIARGSANRSGGIETWQRQLPRRRRG